MYYRQFGDIDRLHKVFPALCAYAKWWRLNRTWPDGTYWSSGWGTGMDNMPRVKPEYNPIFSHGHMVWLDTNLQQMLVDESLLNIGFHIERWQEIEDMEDEMKRLRAYVNEHLWDDATGFLLSLIHICVFSHVDEIRRGKLVASGTMPEPSIADAPQEDHFGYIFNGWIRIPERCV